MYDVLQTRSQSNKTFTPVPILIVKLKNWSIQKNCYFYASAKVNSKKQWNGMCKKVKQKLVKLISIFVFENIFSPFMQMMS